MRTLPAPNETSLASLRTWLLHRAMPLWLAHGVDHRAGAFHEFLHRDGYACDADYRRLRVAARQVWAFSQAHAAGVEGADAAVALGVEYLIRHAARDDGGYAGRFDLNHRPIEGTRDLYDHAFVLLAFAGAAAVLPVAQLRLRALALEAFIGTAFAHPVAGYLESLPPALPRRQNPHMHLLEALLAAHEAFGDTIFLARARSVAELFLTRLYQPGSGTIAEYFDDGFRPVQGESGFVIEPGHHCEWVWLLRRTALLAGPDPRLEAASHRLMDFVDRRGLHPVSGDVIDEARSSGGASVLSARLWPQTERLKAEFMRPGASAAGQQVAIEQLDAWLLPDGLWYERRDADGTPIAGPTPASSLYHLTCGILEAGRVG